MEPMKYRRCGHSGIELPEISLGLWHNFGDEDSYDEGKGIISTALDLGICHFDLADNYGPPPGAAETRLGDLLQRHFPGKRDEMFIATKAGHLMWPGPYGDFGSRKHLIAGINQSLRRLQLDYVDVFYHHRPDPATPLEETVSALEQIVRSGKALYVGLSKYPPELFHRACQLLKEAGVPCLLHQFRYNILDRTCEQGMIPATAEEQSGAIVFSPLAQGILTGKYLINKSLDDSRAMRNNSVFLDMPRAQASNAIVQQLQHIANEEGISLTHLALRWLLDRPHITSVLIGARTQQQLVDCAKASHLKPLSKESIARIDKIHFAS